MLVVIDTETSGLYPWRGARICGWAAMVDGREPYYVAFRHRLPDRPTLFYTGAEQHQRSEQEAKFRLELLLSQADVLIGHNLKFDLHMLAAEGIRPKREARIWDTMIGAFLLNPDEPSFALKALAKSVDPHASQLQDELKRYLAENRLKDEEGNWRFDWVPPDILGAYACKDVELTWRLAQAQWARLSDLAQIDHRILEVAEWDMRLLRTLQQVEEYGVCVDLSRCIELEQECSRRITELEEAARRMIGREIRLSSTRQVADQLRRLGIEGALSTATGEVSTSELSLASVDHPFVRLLLEYRSWVKARATYRSLQELTVDGRLHPQLNQVGYVTGRIACSNPNLQGLPHPDEIHREREVIVASPGCRLWFFDYSQMELRTLANYAEEPAMVQAFREGQDIHQATAELLGVSRRDAKRVNFGLVYGTGPHALARLWGLTPERAQELIRRHREVYPRVRALTQEVERVARTRGYIYYWTGRRRDTSSLPGHKVLQTLISGGCADVMRRAMVRVQEIARRAGGSIVAQIHDELIVELPEGADWAVPEIVEAMEDFEFFELVPLKVDISCGTSWAKKREVVV